MLTSLDFEPEPSAPRQDLRTAGVVRVRTRAELATARALSRWLGDQDFHRSHQSSPLRKDPEHYGPMFPGVPEDLPYVWPVP